jgi:ABC-2 type transport system ATP-binding protein
MNAVEVTDLKKTYKDGFLGRREIEALRGVTFAVPEGQVFGLLGPNGAGKTTMIKILLGIARRTDGEASVLGSPVGAVAARQRIGYLPEHHRIPQHHTGFSALEYYGGLSGMTPSQVRDKRDDLLKTVGLGEWGETAVKKYSKGMLQRLGLAQAMLHDPDLIILDEPTDGVDPVGRAEIRDVLNELKGRGKTIFLNSHLLQEVELVCDQIVILNKGLVRRTGTIEELTNQLGAGVVVGVRADEAAVRKALSADQIVDCAAAGDGVDVKLKPTDDKDVDAIVDKLREAGLSIGGIRRDTRTLEEAFLDVIREGDD